MKMLKRVMNLVLLLSVFTLSLNAQSSEIAKANSSTTSEDISEETYEQILDAYLTVKFREYAYEKLELSPEEINKLDPIYLDYMSEKNELMEGRNELIADYREEMREDDTASDEAEESADFIEDYWEINIAGEELRKDYFDQMEDAIPYQKAFSFFLLEETVEDMAMQQQVIELVPVVIELENPSMGYYREMNRYNTWMQTNKDIDINGTVKLDHAYTYNGLSKLTNAIKATARVADADVTSLNKRVRTIMEKAGQMQNDAYANTHADLAKAAFKMTTELMEDLNETASISIDATQIEKMRNITNRIDVDKLYMEQSEHAYMFFTYAQEAINDAYTMKSFIAPAVSGINTSDK